MKRIRSSTGSCMAAEDSRPVAGRGLSLSVLPGCLGATRRVSPRSGRKNSEAQLDRHGLPRLRTHSQPHPHLAIADLDLPLRAKEIEAALAEGIGALERGVGASLDRRRQ